MRALLLLLAAPLWLPFRLVRWLRWRLRSHRTLHVVLSGSIPDIPSPRGLLGMFRRSAHPDLLHLLQALDEAAGDAKLQTVVVQIEHLHCGLARADELRTALCRLRALGKQVIAYGETLGLAGYWVALGATSVRLPPSGSLTVSGIGMEFTLLKGLLDRAGVRAQLLARGRYKSMREMFDAAVMSESNREMLSSLVEDLSAQLVSLVATARGKAPEAVRAQMDSGPFRADEALEHGLIDQTQYWDELWAEVGGESGKVTRLPAYRKRLRGRHLWPRRAVSVALVRISGNIRSGHDRQGRSGPRATGSQSLRRALSQITKSQRVRALVVRVDSPGGSALASDLMWRELTLAAAKKPTFVSMVNVAASGGYYTSGIKGVPVWASPTTLTGSIGVVGGKFELSGLLGKLGVGHESVTSGPRAAFYSPAQPWSDADLQKVEQDIDASYRDFVTKMADARGMSFDALHEVAQGRVWTGRQARDAALVDHLGGLHEVERAVRERLALPRHVAIRWVSPSPERRLRPEGDAEAAALGTFATGIPELGAWLERVHDLSGETLWALSPIEPRWHPGG